jgi:hypothetical protein
MTNMTIARQRLAKHFPERYAVNKQVWLPRYYKLIRRNNSSGNLGGCEFYSVRAKL